MEWRMIPGIIRRHEVMKYASIVITRSVTDPVRLQWNSERSYPIMAFFSSPEFAALRTKGEYIAEIQRLAARNGSGFWIGQEHPRMGRFLGYLVTTRGARKVLEVGYQCGGSAVPIIEALDNLPGGRYLGIDAEAEGAGVGYGKLLHDYLAMRGLDKGEYRFQVGDAEEELRRVDHNTKFDLIFIDHAKDRYLPTLDVILGRGLYHESTVFLFHDVYTFAYQFMPSIYARFRRHLSTSKVREGIAICTTPISV